MTQKKVLLIELNEFNSELLEQASKELKLQSIQKLLSFEKSVTFTEDTYEDDYLEPWVQWVSVHTGLPSKKHKIKHLGDVPNLGVKQIWEELSALNVTSGVWGAMNASKGSADNCLFFLPDPWCASEKAEPESLNKLLDFLRYTSKNYLNKDLRILIYSFFNVLKLFKSNALLKEFIKEIPALLKNMAKFKGRPFIIISLFDYLSTILFLKYRASYNPDFSLIFLNSLAHLQHHHWNEVPIRQNEKLKYGLYFVDRILKLLFDSVSDRDTILLTNALSQKNTAHDKPWILYRQKDQGHFLKTIGIDFKKVEPHMTHDAHIYFNSSQECMQAKKILEKATIAGQPLFLVEDYTQEPKKLFYRLCFTDEVSTSEKILIDDRSFSFHHLFKPIVKRTGKHIPEGTLFHKNGFFPKTIMNHELQKHILNSFQSGKNLV